MQRDASRPVSLTSARVHRDFCGYALDEARLTYCGQPSLYRFRMQDWPAWRFGCVCAEHARIVRTWSGLQVIHTRRAAR